MSTAPWAWQIVIPALFIVAGAWLLVRSWWPRRTGTSRHCRRCGYNVDGIQSEKCPECGSRLAETAVVIGQRHRRPVAAILSLCLLVLGLAFAATVAEHRWLGKINWYAYRPYSWLLRDLNSTDRWAATRAWDELLRREQTSALNDQQFQTMIERALTEQAAPTPTSLTGPMMAFLDRVAFHGDLTEPQRLRYITNATQASLTILPPDSPGKPYELHVSRIGRGGDISWLQSWRLHLTVDGQPMPIPDGEDTAWGITGPSSHDPLPLSPGKHQIRAIIENSIGSDEVHLFADEDHQPPVQSLVVDVEVPGRAVPRPTLTKGSR
jgi:hypothetical protein